MPIINSHTFNPEIVYAFDCWNSEGHFNAPHSHEYTEISIMLEGEALYTIEDEKHLVKANTVMVFNPGVVHWEKQPLNTSAHELHIGIRNFLLTGYPKDTMPNKETILSPQGNHHKIMDIAWNIVHELEQESLEFRAMTKALTVQLIVQIIRSLEASQDLYLIGINPTVSRKQSLVTDALHYIDRHYNEELTIDQIAQELLISPTYLSRIFKEVQDISVINYLIDIRMKHASTLLKESNLAVKEVAQLVGYQDPLYFSKQFKKYFGKTPSHYKTS